MDVDKNLESVLSVRRRPTLAQACKGPLSAFLEGRTVLEAGAADSEEALAAEGTQEVVLSAYRLQDAADYRTALQAWFRAVKVGGLLIVVVPHAFLYERRLSLPSQWNPHQRRLYTPRSLMEEVEEALEPNAYRVRWLGDYDQGYEYGLSGELEPAGPSDVLLVLERIAPPPWRLATSRAGPDEIKALTTDFAFEPARTRVEFSGPRARRRVVILKLDHLGDFIMGIGALERARAVFSDSEITLVVGSWNVDMARQLGLADRVVAFDAFPRNSSEEEPDVPGTAALFKRVVCEAFDLAIDLRTDHDTRHLLRYVKAPLKAGVGTRAQFPFLDIFLPVDFSRNEAETARVDELNHRVFSCQPGVKRSDYRMSCRKEDAGRDCAIVWGPYFRQRPGQYIFEPYLEFEPAADGLLRLDIAVDAGRRIAELIVPSRRPPRLSFTIEESDTVFEFRIWAVDGAPTLDFSFFGGRLMRAGASSVLHQSEYLSLLIELIAMRMDRTGVLAPEPAL